MRRVWFTFWACALAVLLFFFFVPIVWTNLEPCLIIGGYGYSSLSHYFFNVGAIYQFGHLIWSNQSLTDCL